MGVSGAFVFYPLDMKGLSVLNKIVSLVMHEILKVTVCSEGLLL